MDNEYIIVNKTLLEKRIEELEKERKIMWWLERDTLQQILSQSTPLIPEIEKAFNAGYDLNTLEGMEIPNEERSYLNEQEYISNLKLDI